MCSLRCNSAIRTTAERNTEAVSAARLRNQVVVAYAFLAVMVATALPTPLYPIYEKQLGLSSLDVTAIYGVYAVVVLATLAMFGRVSDHLGRRPVLLMAVAAAALGEVVLLTEPQTAGLYVGRAVIGFAAGLMIGSTTAYLVDLGADNNAGRAHIFAVVANLGGQAVGAVLAGVAAQFLPHPLALPYGVGLILLGPVALLWVLRVPETVLRNDDLRGAFTPGLGALPPQVRSTFRATAATFVAAFALLGFLTALTGSILVQQLHRPGSLTVGLVTFAVRGRCDRSIGRVRRHADAREGRRARTASGRRPAPGCRDVGALVPPAAVRGTHLRTGRWGQFAPRNGPSARRVPAGETRPSQFGLVCDCLSGCVTSDGRGGPDGHGSEPDHCSSCFDRGRSCAHPRGRSDESPVDSRPCPRARRPVR